MKTQDINAQIDAAAEVIVTRCQANPLPFIVPDPDDPHAALSMWTVTETGDYWFDLLTGTAYAEDLTQRMKEISKRFGSSTIGSLAIESVLQAVTGDTLKSPQAIQIGCRRNPPTKGKTRDPR